MTTCNTMTKLEKSKTLNGTPILVQLMP